MNISCCDVGGNLGHFCGLNFYYCVFVANKGDEEDAGMLNFIT